MSKIIVDQSKGCCHGMRVTTYKCRWEVLIRANYMTGVGRTSYVSTYFLKVIIMINFRSTTDESFSAKCSMWPFWLF